jgi:hypothetical protein
MNKKPKTPKAPETTDATPKYLPAPRAVVVTTEHKGVFFGYVADESKLPAQVTLTQAAARRALAMRIWRMLSCVSAVDHLNGLVMLHSVSA